MFFRGKGIHVCMYVVSSSHITNELVQLHVRTHLSCRLCAYIICTYILASFPGSPSPRTNYTRVTFDLAERLRESLVHFGT